MSNWALCFWLKHYTIPDEQYSLVGISSEDPEDGALGEMEMMNDIHFVTCYYLLSIANLPKTS